MWATCSCRGQCSVVAAANPPEQAADGWDLSPPLANRFLHIAYRPPVDGWVDGMTAGFSLPAGGRVAQPSRERTAVPGSNVAAFIRSRPALLDAFPTNPAASGRAWPSRRTWTMTADVLALLEPDDTEAAHLAACGLVGEGAAVEYLTWRRQADLPDPASVVADPRSVAWRSLDPSRTWAILAGSSATAPAAARSRPGARAGVRWPSQPSWARATWLPPAPGRCSRPAHPMLARRWRCARSLAC